MSSIIAVQRTIDFDPQHRRAYSGAKRSRTRAMQVELELNKRYCQNIEVTLDVRIFKIEPLFSDFILIKSVFLIWFKRVASKSTYSEPLAVNIRVVTSDCHSKTDVDAIIISPNNHDGNPKEDKFSKLCPMFRKEETFLRIPFSEECGSDFNCRSDLNVTCEIVEAS